MTTYQQDFFRRRLVDSALQSKVESICNFCGDEMLASVTEGIEYMETEHVEHCLGSSE